MANGFGSFYIGNSGLSSAQNAINVVANNLANVDTAGYVRQQVIFSDKHYITVQKESIKTMMHQDGLGVSIGDVVHARDIFLDKAYRQENGREAFYESCYEVVSQVEDLFQELDGEELKRSVENIRRGFQQLAAAPGDSVNQNLVIQQSEILLSRFDALYKDLKDYQENLNRQIRGKVDEINEIGARIFELNTHIQKVEAGGIETAMTARDERDYLVDKLSGLVHIDYKETSDGIVKIDIEGTEFITESRLNTIGLKEEDLTGFVNPYWNHLTDEKAEKYTYVFQNLLDISTEDNTDIGTLKSLLYQRGSGYGNYKDLESMEAFAKIEDCTLMETEAQVDLLMHSIITSVTDLMIPNTEVSGKIDITAQGQPVLTDPDNGKKYIEVALGDGTTYKIYEDAKMLDKKNCTVGIDGKIPPQEIFVRVGCSRYQEVTLTDNEGNTESFYIYNEEDPTDSSTWYAIGSVKINQELKSQESLLPTWRQNGDVDYGLGNDLAQKFDEALMTLDPTDNTPCTFEDYYNKIMDNLGTTGNVYYSSTETLTTSVASIDNQRQQISGVSSDEELSHMIKYQSAYNAASRYITVISEMTDLIVQLI